MISRPNQDEGAPNVVRYLMLEGSGGKLMRAHWMSAVLLGSVLAAACGGQKAPDAQEIAANAPPATAATADATAPVAAPVSPSEDTTPAVPSASAAKPSAAKPAAPARLTAKPATAKPAAASTSVAEPAAPPAPPAPPAAPKVEYRTLKVPANTALALQLVTPLSSETTTVETPVSARLKQAVNVDGLTVLPAGTMLQGSVTEVEPSGRVKGKSRLAFAFTQATVAGAKEKLHTAPLVFEGESTKGKDATKIGVGAGVGAVIGGILGGGSGAAKGAAIGGGAGTGVVLATKGAEVTLAEGTDLATTLADPFELRVRVE